MERKSISIQKWLAIFAALCLSFPVQSLSQSGEGKRVSFTLGSGLTYGSAGDGVVGRLAGNFNVPSFRQQIYGGSFQYAASPAFSIDTGVQVGSFTNQYDFDPAFENDFFYATIKGVTNLNGLLGLNSRFMNPYFSVGLGMIRSQIVTDDLDSEDLSLLGTAGAGVNFYLFRGADLFVQYDYIAAGSDLLDGLSGSGSSDQFAAVSAGLRINFGSSGSKLISWPPARDSRIEISTGADLNRAEEHEVEVTVERQVAPDPQNLQEKEEREQRLQQMVNEANREMMRQQEQNRVFAEQWRAEQRQKQLEAEAEARRQQIFTNRPDPGHYIQVYSFSNRAAAEEMRAKLAEDLGSQLDQAGQRVIIHQFDGLNRVLIGSFQRYRNANSILQQLDSGYGAFIITYPRPDDM
ncbi:SPOR domain-containing protein [Rhodohalobacter halophilus]|uniref:SPOR domain-containing protein n=1 Tax=Rhodohalobacter halophilus TaxID=1812810 RepID=UPI00083FC81F|nr:SPOR domain-containing protein [Rhodohalobacter halophilus]